MICKASSGPILLRQRSHQRFAQYGANSAVSPVNGVLEFDLNASEDRIGLANVIFCNSLGGPADDVSGAFGETKLHWSTSPGIRELEIDLVLNKCAQSFRDFCQGRDEYAAGCSSRTLA